MLEGIYCNILEGKTDDAPIVKEGGETLIDLIKNGATMQEKKTDAKGM